MGIKLGVHSHGDLTRRIQIESNRYYLKRGPYPKPRIWVNEEGAIFSVY